MSVEVLPARPIVSRRTLGPRFFFRWILIGLLASLVAWYLMRSLIFPRAVLSFSGTGTRGNLDMSELDKEIAARKLAIGGVRNLFPVDPESSKLVLFWTNFFGTPDTRGELGPRLFEGCPVPQCSATGDKNQAADSAAVIFHALDIDPKRLPGPRRPGQHYVFLIGESPSSATGRVEAAPDNFYDMVYSYRLESDVLGHYMYSVPVEKAPRNFAAGKTKLVAWFVSNCKTQSRRENYVSALQKFIPVDVYGKCGPLSCPRNQTDACNAMLGKDYKFYLAFENSICRDYVTEKFTVALQNNVVPVVLGGGNTTIFPPKSYIHIDDFPSIKELADYLQYLDKNDTAYNEYMVWRFDPTLVQSHGPFSSGNSGWCQLCERLHDPAYHPKGYSDARKWFLDGGQCRAGTW